MTKNRHYIMHRHGILFRVVESFESFNFSTGNYCTHLRVDSEWKNESEAKTHCELLNKQQNLIPPTPSNQPLREGKTKSNVKPPTPNERQCPPPPPPIRKWKEGEQPREIIYKP